MNGSDIDAGVHQWSVNPPADTLGIRFDQAPDPATRDYLRALHRSGTVVTWSSQAINPTMIEIEPLEDPAGGALARVTGRSGAPLVLRDSLGVVDSFSITGLGATVRLPSFTGSLVAGSGKTEARIGEGRPTSARALLVLGMAGWESKFVIQALEERGWQVDARTAIAPGLSVDRGRPFPIDTPRYAAVVALDSTAAGYSRQLVEYVQAGGGLILGGGTRPPVFRPVDDQPVTSSQSGERQAVTLWRLGTGRVLLNGNRDTWRWRMETDDRSVTSHRAWWAALVSTVAYRPGRVTNETDDPAPLAALTLDLGPTSDLPSERSRRAIWPFVLGIVAVSLLTEWTSRRTRGAL